MAEGPKVLVVDDEPNIRELVQVALNFHGFTVTTSATGEDALQLAEAYRPDLIVLDVLLPDIDGFEVCRRLRSVANDVPVIFLTARDTTADTVTGLTLGGDDYITKPFSVEALIARVRAVLRRTAGRRGRADARRRPGRRRPDDAQARLRVADLELDEDHWTVRRAGIPVELSPTEFRLLAYLMRNQGLMLTRKQLLENVWGWEYAGQSQVLETYVSYLRRKLDPLGPPLIHTQRGVGYSLRPGGDPPCPPMSARSGQTPRGCALKRRSLSLRARLLAGLIALTTTFLVVMGVVTTVVLGTLDRNQLNAEVKLASRQSVLGMAAGADGFAAAYASLAQRQVRHANAQLADRRRAAHGGPRPDGPVAAAGTRRGSAGWRRPGSRST